MSKVKFKKYLHRSKEDNIELAEHFGDDGLKWLGYEEELVYEYDTESKKVKLIGAGGFFLSEEKISPGDLEKVP